MIAQFTHRTLRAGIVALGLAAPAFAQNAVPVDAVTQARIDQGVVIGREIYAHDQAAWHATDEMLAKVAEEKLARGVGFVTERVGLEQIRAVFVQDLGGELREMFSAVVRGSNVESSQDFAGKSDATLLSPKLLKSFHAQEKVRELLRNEICGRPPNIVVFDSATKPGGLDVYAIVPEFAQEEAVLAGHKRYTFGPDGGEPELHDYYNSCLIARRGPDSVMLVLTVPPNRGDIPHELHNFGSLNLKTQMSVLTTANGRTWGISEGIPLLLAEDKKLAAPQEQ